MKALLCKRHGPPHMLELSEVEPPPCAPQAVRIAVRAAGVNYPDALIIQGKYQFQPPLPFAPGGEVAGEVLEVGAQVEGFQVGQRVLGLTGWNGFAEQAVVPADKCFVIPAAMDWATAAGFGMTYGTVAHALIQRGQLREGEVLLVHGASGGVGTAAIEVGKALGARIIATSGSAAKLEVLRRLYGVEHAIDVSREPMKDAVKRITAGRGANVIFDPVGGELFEQSLRCIDWEGRLLVVGFASGTIPAAKANLVLLKGCSVVGVFWGAFATRDPETNADNFRRLFSWYQAGRLAPHVSHRFPLAEGARAIQALLDREVIGKAVLEVG